MPDSADAGLSPQMLKSALRDLNGSNANRISTSRRASFSNFGRFGGGVAVAENEQVHLAGRIAVVQQRDQQDQAKAARPGR